MKRGTCNRSSGGFLKLRIHLSDGSYKAVNATPTTQCSTILEKVVGPDYSKEDFELKVKYKNSSPSVLSGDTYLRDLIPAAKNDELEEIVLCKKAGGIIRRFSHDLLLHSHSNKVKPLDIVTVSLPLQTDYDVAPVKNEKVASIFSSAWSVGTQHHEKMPMDRSLSVVSTPPQDELSSHDSAERTRKVTIPVLQTQTRKRVGVKMQRRNLFRRSSSTCTTDTSHAYSHTRSCSSSSGVYEDVSDGTDDAIDGCSDTAGDGHCANVSSLQYSRRRSLSVGDLRCLPYSEYMEMKSITTGGRRTTSSTVNCQLVPNAANHGSLAKFKSSKSVELLTDDDIEHITEYTLQLDSEDDMPQQPDVPERSSSLHSTHFSVPDAVLIEQGKRWNAVFGSREKKGSGTSWNLGAIKSAINKMTRKISVGRKQSSADESPNYSVAKLLAKSNTRSPKKPIVNSPAIGSVSMEQDMAKSRYKTHSYSTIDTLDSITPVQCSHHTLPSLHNMCYSYTDAPESDDYVVMSPAYIHPFNQTRKVSISQPSLVDSVDARPYFLNQFEQKPEVESEPVYDVPIMPPSLKTSRSFSHELIQESNGPVRRSTTPLVLFGSPLQSYSMPLPSPVTDSGLVPAYCDDAFANTRTSNLDVTATVSTNSFEQIDSGKLSWIYGDYSDAAPDC